jgi:uncharacterized protein YrrD
MKFKYGADIENAKHEKVGEIERIVIDPSTGEVTHIIVRKGLFLTNDKVLPTSLIADATEERVVLHEFEGNLDDMPDYVEEHFIPTRFAHTYHLHYGPAYLFPYPPMRISKILFTEKKASRGTTIPEDAASITQGANVITVDGKKVGDLKQVFVHPQTDRATHLLISKGFLWKEDKVIPTGWVKEFHKDWVDLVVNSNVIDHLPMYKKELES